MDKLPVYSYTYLSENYITYLYASNQLFFYFLGKFLLSFYAPDGKKEDKEFLDLFCWKEKVQMGSSYIFIIQKPWRKS